MYKTYEEIPVLIKSYIETVADDCLANLPLEDINGLLELLNERNENAEFEEYLEPNFPI